MVCMRLALKRNEVPPPAILEVYDENSQNNDDEVHVYILSAGDTTTLRLFLQDVDWEAGESISPPTDRPYGVASIAFIFPKMRGDMMVSTM